MARKTLYSAIAGHLPFNIPYIASKIPRVGRQPYAPGQSQMDSGGPEFQLVPWPNTVPALFATANNPGMPRTKALGIVNNQNIALPANYLFIAGFAQKSKG